MFTDNNYKWVFYWAKSLVLSWKSMYFVGIDKNELSSCGGSVT